jgi:hypothetical protein
VLRLKKEVVVALEIHHGLNSRIDVLLVNAMNVGIELNWRIYLQQTEGSLEKSRRRTTQR